MAAVKSILGSKDITFLTKIHIVKAMVFPVVMYGCDSWTIKKAECYRIDAFELWCWRRLFWVPWTARRSNQSILKEINPEYSLGGPMLKLQHFGHLMGRVVLLENILMLGKIEGRRRTDSMGMNLSKLWERVKDRRPSCAAVHEVGKSQTRFSGWRTIIWWLFSVRWLT